MANLSICNNTVCSRKDKCKRYAIEYDEDYQFIHFANICNEIYDFRWFVEKKEDIIEKTEGENN